MLPSRPLAAKTRLVAASQTTPSLPRPISGVATTLPVRAFITANTGWGPLQPTNSRKVEDRRRAVLVGRVAAPSLGHEGGDVRHLRVVDRPDHLAGGGVVDRHALLAPAQEQIGPRRIDRHIIPSRRSALQGHRRL